MEEIKKMKTKWLTSKNPTEIEQHMNEFDSTHKVKFTQTSMSYHLAEQEMYYLAVVFYEE